MWVAAVAKLTVLQNKKQKKSPIVQLPHPECPQLAGCSTGHRHLWKNKSQFTVYKAMHIFILRYLSFLLLAFFLQYFYENFLAKVFNLEATLTSTLNTHGSKTVNRSKPQPSVSLLLLFPVYFWMAHRLIPQKTD